MVSFVIAVPAARVQQKQTTGSECSADVQHQACALIFQAFDAAKKLSHGMTRADVEKEFEMDGGIAFPPTNTYTFKGCSGLKIDVEFKRPDGQSIGKFEGSDVIVSVSKVYVEPAYKD
jgi:hypothetical protein